MVSATIKTTIVVVSMMEAIAVGIQERRNSTHIVTRLMDVSAWTQTHKRQRHVRMVVRAERRIYKGTVFAMIQIIIVAVSMMEAIAVGIQERRNSTHTVTRLMVANVLTPSIKVNR